MGCLCAALVLSIFNFRFVDTLSTLEIERPYMIIISVLDFGLVCVAFIF